MNKIETGTQVAWLLSGRKGRAVMGTILDVSDERATVDVTSVENRRDNDKIGTRWSVAISDLQTV